MGLGTPDGGNGSEPRDALRPKPPATKKRPKYWFKEWQWYALFTVVGMVIMVTGLIATIAYLVLAGIAIALFAVFGVAYGLLKERSF
jgi:hypothetical protein